MQGLKVVSMAGKWLHTACFWRRACSRCSYCSTLIFLFLFAMVGGPCRAGLSCVLAGLLLAALLRVPHELAFPVPDQAIQGLSASACGCSVSAAAYDSGVGSLVLLRILIGRLPRLFPAGSLLGCERLALCVMPPARVQAQTPPPDWRMLFDGRCMVTVPHSRRAQQHTCME